jgi:hypothetical protein
MNAARICPDSSRRTTARPPGAAYSPNLGIFLRRANELRNVTPVGDDMGACKAPFFAEVTSWMLEASSYRRRSNSRTSPAAFDTTFTEKR